MNDIHVHEINLSASAFNRFTNSDYIILESAEVEANDYILFKQVETLLEGDVEPTGLYRMTQVKEIIQDPGLKDGYIMIIVQKL